MHVLRTAIASLVLVTITLTGGHARAADEKKVDPKAPEVEKVLFEVPDDVTQGAWIKMWREKIVISYTQEMTVGVRGQLESGEIVRFTLENKTPCVIKVSSDLSRIKWQDRLAGLSTDGRPAKKPAAKEKREEPASETWTVEPGKKLVIFKKPATGNKVMEVPLRNDLDKKALISVLYTGAICFIEVVPTDKDAKPVELLLSSKVGANGNKVAVSGFYLCRAADAKEFVDKLSKIK